MKWKSVKNNRPTTCSVMGHSNDLLMFDGENYHRGYALFNKSNNSNDCSLKKPRYFSIDAQAYIIPIEFLEINRAEKAIHGNIWSNQYKIE